MPELFEQSEGQTPQEDPQRQEGSQPEGRSEAVAETRGAVRDDVRARHTGRDARGQELVRRPVTRTQKRVIAFTWIALFFLMIYTVFITMALFTPGYSFVDRVASIFLFLGTMFIFLHGLGYANSMIKASWGYDEIKRRVFSPQREPKVVCLIASFNEPLAMMEETVAAMTSMDYGNKEVVILDDSTKEEIRQGVRDIGAKYGATVRQRTNRRGYKAGAINDFLRTTDAPYLAIFDADGLPAHNLLRDLMPIIEENPRLAFVQTPQYYANTDVSNVAMGASRQQAVFYEYICEGKSYSRSAFCCGTNVVFRRDALLAVGGFDESSVTEDFMTSLGLHLKGYDSTYYNQVYAYSMAPETLTAYFTQQGRWAFGSVGGMWKVLKAMITKPGALSFGQWWEYFLSTTYYFVGWVNFVFMLMPMLYIFFDIKPLRADVFTYMAIFVPYLIFTMNMFYSGMEQRGYKVGEMLLGQQIGFICFPVHMSSSLSGFLGLKRPFAVTPKGVPGKTNWLALWPQLLMLVLSAIAFLWGMYRYIMGVDRNDAAIVINSIWALYHVVLLAGIFRLNRNLKEASSRRYFADEKGRLYPEEDPRVRPAAGAPIPAGAVAATTASGRIARPAIATPLRPARPGVTGRFALVLGLVTLGLIVAVGATMANWAMRPTTPVNVYILDRTTGRDYQEHRALTWTLNFLKVRKQPEFHPETTTSGRTNYDWAADFYGFVPDSSRMQKIKGQADYLAGGQNRLLPDELQTPGALYLADTYGEFVEWDPGQNAYVKYQSDPRGVTPDDVDRIQDFYDRRGLVIAEWNTIGYPTLPGREEDYDAIDRELRRGVADVEKGIAFLNSDQQGSLRWHEAELARARASGDSAWVARQQKEVEDARDRLQNLTADLATRRQKMEERAGYQEQLAAQQQLEKILHVDYQGWYGRYVDKFEKEEEFDRRLFQNVKEFSDKKRFPNGPKGPGFVFYQDGPSRVRDPQSDPNNPRYIENPFSVPIIITQDELRQGPINLVSGVYTAKKTNTGADISNDPLLRGVKTDGIPTHYWFELVKPAPGSTVLAYYKLLVTDAAIERLRRAGFPAAFLSKAADGPQIVFPAAVAFREGRELRSFYMAGDASDYPLVSRITEMFPSTGGVQAFLGSRVGSFSQQYYWNYYEPMLRNVLTATPRIRYNAATAVARAE